MRIHVHGNCQAVAMAAMLREACPDWQVTASEAPAIPLDDPDALAAYEAAATGADLLLAQPVGATYRGTDRFATERLRALRRPEAATLTFPSIYFAGQHPGIDYLSDRLPGFGMPYHDLHLVDLVLRGRRPAVIAATLLDEEFYDGAFLEAEIAASLAELHAREVEAAIDLPVSGLLGRACRRGVVMHTINHPCRLVLAAVLNAALQRIGAPDRVAPRGPEPLPDPHIPPLPAVLRHLGLRPGRTAAYLVGGRRAAAARWLAEAARHYAAIPPGELALHLLGRPGAMAFLQRFHAHHDPAPAEGAEERLLRQLLQRLAGHELGRDLTAAELGGRLALARSHGVELMLAAFRAERARDRAAGLGPGGGAR